MSEGRGAAEARASAQEPSAQRVGVPWPGSGVPVLSPTVCEAEAPGQGQGWVGRRAGKHAPGGRGRCRPSSGQGGPGWQWARQEGRSARLKRSDQPPPTLKTHVWAPQSAHGTFPTSGQKDREPISSLGSSGPGVVRTGPGREGRPQPRRRPQAPPRAPPPCPQAVVGDSEYHHFRYRIPPARVRLLEVGGDLQLDSVKIF